MVRKTAVKRAQKILKATHDGVFKRIHGGQLIYNAVWEDPRIDRQLLKLDRNSRVVMITSAGCNALDYLLDDPAEIHAVDMNYRQNALLDLKLAMIRRGSFQDLFEMFGIGSHQDHKIVYRAVRKDLPVKSKDFWDEKIKFFHPGSLKKSFYYHGTSGSAAWLMGGVLFRAKPNIKNFAMCLLNAETLEQQQEVYEWLEPKIWSKLSRWLVRQPWIMALLGVPRPQIQLIEQSHAGGLTAYIKDKLRHVMTALPAAENYFWRVYVTGSYTLSCCPGYLRRENLPILAERHANLQRHTHTISGFLRENPGKYSHYVLLDHQDWLAWHDPAALREEWDLILQNSAPGARILMRSAGLDLSFVPEDIQSRVTFFPQLTAPLHLTDRVGTYGSLHLAEVR